jgi:5-methylcytosine-specific restriction endonuclease McrA
MDNPRRKQCGKPDCKRAFNAERARAWHRSYTATTGQRYATDRYREREAEYYQQRREELGHWRTRYPERASLVDARRRMLLQHADQGERFAPADVHERDNWTCRLCLLPVDPALPWPHPMSASVDHILPLSRGGSHTLANVQCAHLS